MLVCTKTIFSALWNYLKTGTLQGLEKPKYKNIENMLKKYEIYKKNIKNDEYFNVLYKNIGKKECLKKDLLNFKQLLVECILKIGVFLKQVKSICKNGVGIECDYKKLTHALAVAPYVYGENILIDYFAGSGILNSYLYG